MIFFAGHGFNAAVDIHGLRGDAGDCFRDVFFLQAPGKDEGMGFFHLDGNVPIGLKARSAVVPLITGIRSSSRSCEKSGDITVTSMSLQLLERLLAQIVPVVPESP